VAKIVYDAGSGSVVLNTQRGPHDFRAYYQTRKHDNLATSGVRERVLEGNDILISFRMGFMKVDDDLAAWAAFMKYALGGGQFDFYPHDTINEQYHCVSEDEGFEPERVAPGRYAAGFVFRVAPDVLAPADPGVVLKRFNGIAG
jgi:hypothetical protein